MSESARDAPEAIARDKELAARTAVALAEPGMVLGLGAGSTAQLAVRALAERAARGELRGVVGVPCSLETEALARSLGLAVVSLDDHPVIDLTIDGADEVDARLNLVKGAGGALLREKMVAQASRREVIVADGRKRVHALGSTRAVPVEVVPFGAGAQARFLEGLGARVTLRAGADGAPFHTDQGNVIFDCDFGAIAHPGALARKLEARAGVVAHGLFLDLATEVVIADGGVVRTMRRGEILLA